VSTWLTADWLNDAMAAMADVDLPAEREGVVQCTVTGGAEDGADVVISAQVQAGRLRALVRGVDDTAVLTLTLSAGDAWDVLVGDLGASVAFMQGRLKVEGDMGLLLDLLASTSAAEADSARRSLAATTQR